MAEAATLAPELKTLGDQISKLQLGQAAALVKYLEEAYGIKPAAGGGVMMAMPAGGGAAAEKPPEKTEFTVMLEGLEAADAKIGVIKVVREITGLGLKEAKDLVEGAPKPVKENLPKDEAEKLQKKLQEAKAKVSLK
jgi:large subunit ribosomal protein L7/L12